jgi:hypothetical protein
MNEFFEKSLEIPTSSFVEVFSYDSLCSATPRPKWASMVPPLSHPKNRYVLFFVAFSLLPSQSHFMLSALCNYGTLLVFTNSLAMAGENSLLNVMRAKPLKPGPVRWPLHIQVIHPFVPMHAIPSTLQAMRNLNVEPFKVVMPRFGHFSTGRDFVLYLEPSEGRDSLVRLYLSVCDSLQLDPKSGLSQFVCEKIGFLMFWQYLSAPVCAPFDRGSF